MTSREENLKRNLNAIEGLKKDQLKDKLKAFNLGLLNLDRFTKQQLQRLLVYAVLKKIDIYNIYNRGNGNSQIKTILRNNLGYTNENITKMQIATRRSQRT